MLFTKVCSINLSEKREFWPQFPVQKLPKKILAEESKSDLDFFGGPKMLDSDLRVIAVRSNQAVQYD